ncbi:MULTISPECIES: hypothetical protein [unclassified Streptomyces]|uniref:hypothetical protein n=1 Tax=unclassified Streptomyces TaxID=2593676 RepID=UPI001BED2C6A|nr:MULTISPECIES: hypothetical protein [unclassified Streptomyces]MBT2404793.1 hypothetical protein [Streptomyces sp. ISL-21]
MLMAWDKLRGQWPDELDLLGNLTVLAARNTDVDLLNAGAQEIRRAGGGLGPSCSVGQRTWTPDRLRHPASPHWLQKSFPTSTTSNPANLAGHSTSETGQPQRHT